MSPARASSGTRWSTPAWTPATGRERRRWHAAGTDRADAERLARQLAGDERTRRGQARGRLTFAGFVARHWLPAKRMQLGPTTIEGYERMLRLHILPTLGAVPLGQLRADAVQNPYGRLLLDGRHDGTGGLSAKTVHEVHTVVRNILDDAVRRGLLATNPSRLAASPRFRRDAATLELLAERADHTEHFGGDDANRWVFAKPDGTLLHPQSLS